MIPKTIKIVTFLALFMAGLNVHAMYCSELFSWKSERTRILSAKSWRLVTMTRDQTQFDPQWVHSNPYHHSVMSHTELEVVKRRLFKIKLSLHTDFKKMLWDGYNWYDGRSKGINHVERVLVESLSESIVDTLELISELDKSKSPESELYISLAARQTAISHFYHTFVRSLMNEKEKFLQRMQDFNEVELRKRIYFYQNDMFVKIKQDIFEVAKDSSNLMDVFLTPVIPRIEVVNQLARFGKQIYSFVSEPKFADNIEFSVNSYLEHDSLHALSNVAGSVADKKGNSYLFVPLIRNFLDRAPRFVKPIGFSIIQRVDRIEWGVRRKHFNNYLLGSQFNKYPTGTLKRYLLEFWYFQFTHEESYFATPDGFKAAFLRLDEIGDSYIYRLQDKLENQIMGYDPILRFSPDLVADLKESLEEFRSMVNNYSLIHPDRFVKGLSE